MVFEGACVSCHGWTGESAISPFATLTGAWAVNDPGATNVAQIVISGTKRHTPEGAVSMPAFGNAYSDDEIAAVANYVTARFGSKASAIYGAGRGGAKKANVAIEARRSAASCDRLATRSFMFRRDQWPDRSLRQTARREIQQGFIAAQAAGDIDEAPQQGRGVVGLQRQHQPALRLPRRQCAGSTTLEPVIPE